MCKHIAYVPTVCVANIICKQKHFHKHTFNIQHAAYLSSLMVHTVPNTSTMCSSLNCCVPILVAIKQPVRPIPALEDKWVH